MLKLLLPLTFLIILGIGALFIFQSFGTNPITQKLSPSPIVSSPSPISSDPCEVLTKGSADVPPLYSENVKWGQALKDTHEVTEFEDVSTGKGFSSKKVDGCLIEATTNLNVAGEIRSFYIKELQNSMWKLVDAADGPSGFYTVYKNSSKYFLMKLTNDRMELFYSY